MRVFGFLLAPFPQVSRRKSFEALNQTDEFSRPWPKDRVIEWAFHCSSEGEFEQLRPLMDQCLAAKKPIELIYTSPSVTKRVHGLAQQHPSLVRILRLPIVSSLSLKEWSRASGLVMCRYDFFPSLLLLPVKKRVLVWGSLKGKSQSWWLKQLYKHFDLIVAATKQQQQAFTQLGIMPERLVSYDFRPKQIATRLERANLSSNLGKLLNSRPVNERLILGSVWEHELFLLENLISKKVPMDFWLAPHALASVDVENLCRRWNQLYPEVQILRVKKDMSDSDVDVLFSQAKNATQTAWLVEFPGQLLELYQSFLCAYVGGGFGRSIHSVLEPFMAGCWSSCGPKTHRSTEIDLCQELFNDQVQVVHDASELEQWWLKYHTQESVLKDDNRSDTIHNWLSLSTEVARRTLAN